jgi:hypothetical protein
MNKQSMPVELSRSEQKELIKEAITEWLDGKFTTFGYWVAGALLAAAFAGVVYLALIGQGWKK